MPEPIGYMSEFRRDWTIDGRIISVETVLVLARLDAACHCVGEFCERHALVLGGVHNARRLEIFLLGPLVAGAILDLIDPESYIASPIVCMDVNMTSRSSAITSDIIVPHLIEVISVNRIVPDIRGYEMSHKACPDPSKFEMSAEVIPATRHDAIVLADMVESRKQGPTRSSISPVTIWLSASARWGHPPIGAGGW